MACWVGAQGQVNLADTAKACPNYDITHRKPQSQNKKKIFDWNLRTSWICWGFEQLTGSIGWRVMVLQCSAKKVVPAGLTVNSPGKCGYYRRETTWDWKCWTYLFLECHMRTDFNILVQNSAYFGTCESFKYFKTSWKQSSYVQICFRVWFLYNELDWFCQLCSYF